MATDTLDLKQIGASRKSTAPKQDIVLPPRSARQLAAQVDYADAAKIGADKAEKGGVNLAIASELPKKDCCLKDDLRSKILNVLKDPNLDNKTRREFTELVKSDTKLETFIQSQTEANLKRFVSSANSKPLAQAVTTIAKLEVREVISERPKAANPTHSENAKLPTTHTPTPLADPPRSARQLAAQVDYADAARIGADKAEKGGVNLTIASELPKKDCCLKDDLRSKLLDVLKDPNLDSKTRHNFTELVNDSAKLETFIQSRTEANLKVFISAADSKPLVEAVAAIIRVEPNSILSERAPSLDLPNSVKASSEAATIKEPKAAIQPAIAEPLANSKTVTAEFPQQKLQSKSETRVIEPPLKPENKQPEVPKAEARISEPQRARESEAPRLQESRSFQQSKHTQEHSRETGLAFKEGPASRNSSEQTFSRNEKHSYPSNIVVERTINRDPQINNRTVEQSRIGIPIINREISTRQVPEVSRQTDRSSAALDQTQRVSSIEKLSRSRQESLINIRDLVREMNRSPVGSSRAVLENLRVALDRLAQDPNLRQRPDLVRLNRQVNNQILVREVDRFSRHLDRGSVELTSRQASDLLRRLSKMDGKSLNLESAEQLRKLLRRLDPNFVKSLGDKIDPKLAQMLARQIQQLLQQRVQSQPDSRLGLQRILESNKLANLSTREMRLVDRISQLKEALRLQQLYAKQLGEKLSPADRAQLKKQEQILNRRIDKLEVALSRNRSIQERIINRLIAQIKIGQIPQNLSNSDRQALIKAIDSRASLLTERISNLQKQLETIRQLRVRLQDPVLLKNLLKQERGLERRIALLEKEIDKLRAKRALLNTKEENPKRVPGERHLRVSRMQDAMLRRRLALNADPQLRLLTQTRRLLMVVRAEIRDILRDLSKSGRLDLSQVHRDLLSLRIDKLVRHLSSRDPTTLTDFDRLKRLNEIQLMLREGQELSIRLLEELLELFGEELEDTNEAIAARKNRRKSKSVRNIKKNEERGFGLEVSHELALKKRSKSNAVQDAQFSKSRQVFNSKTGNRIGASSSLPSRSLDVVQSKEDDGEKNEYWKEINN